MSQPKKIISYKSRTSPFVSFQVCEGIQIQTPSEKIKNILDKKPRHAKILQSFRDQNVKKSIAEEETSKNLKNDSISTILMNDTGLKQMNEGHKLCCECNSEDGLGPCKSESCPFLVSCRSQCFFKNLPWLKFAPYTQCQICGQRFDNADFETHVNCDKMYILPPTPQIPDMQKRIIRSRINPKYQEPFIMKTIQPCLDECSCCQAD